ncbi:hypothetical protein CEXT_234581 [Caerostris extrusa]|uniref:Uncharacterized protein n=1 Tax=Caerostris extrusa TaxID=172846 RepID=A0AAV4M6P4_CAEEX|nr:hypothetical protein CEXT_234581 [Caerostris extrusa]
MHIREQIHHPDSVESFRQLRDSPENLQVQTWSHVMVAADLAIAYIILVPLLQPKLVFNSNVSLNTEKPVDTPAASKYIGL